MPKRDAAGEKDVSNSTCIAFRCPASIASGIEGTTARFRDGYNWFSRQPEVVLGFLGKHMN